MSVRGPAARLLIVCAVLAPMSVWTHSQRVAPEVPVPDFDSAVPPALAGWTSHPAPALDPDVARVLAANQYVHRYYTRGTAIIELDLAYYSRPRAGASMHSPLNCLPGNGWEVLERKVVPIAIDSGPVDVRQVVVARAGRRFAITYWFQNRGGLVASELGQRFRLLANALQGHPTDAALVRVMSRIGDRSSPEPAALLQFTRGVLTTLSERLR